MQMLGICSEYVLLQGTTRIDYLVFSDIFKYNKNEYKYTLYEEVSQFGTMKNLFQYVEYFEEKLEGKEEWQIYN